MHRVRSDRGFTLVELMIVVAIVGVLASLGTYGVRRYTSTSKTAEALSNLGGMARAVRAANARETMSGTLLTAGQQTTNDGDTTGSGSGNGNGNGNGATVNHSIPGLCDDSTAVPSSMSSVSGKKYQPNTTPGADYGSGDRFKGWRCLGFSISSPHYFQYRYKTNGPPVEVTLPHGGNPPGLSADQTWAASAQGDLDGDGRTSWFVLQGYLTDRRDIIQAPGIGIQDPEE